MNLSHNVIKKLSKEALNLTDKKHKLTDEEIQYIQSNNQ